MLLRLARLGLVLLIGCGQVFADGKLIATPGVTQFEGSAGGGVVPWAVLAGYATRDQITGSGFATTLSTDDLRLSVAGMAVNLFDRVELSVARQELDVDPLSSTIGMDVYGAKVRLFGDIVYSATPQVSLGVHRKQIRDEAIPLAVGAAETDGTDVYLAIADLQLAAVGGYNFMWNVTARWTSANQTGFLGFGTATDTDKALMWEGSAAILFGRHWAVGVDYRQKPDNLAFAEEQRWADVFVAYVPNKRVNITAAWVDLGDVAGLGNQSGLYVSLTGYLH